MDTLEDLTERMELVRSLLKLVCSPWMRLAYLAVWLPILLLADVPAWPGTTTSNGVLPCPALLTTHDARSTTKVPPLYLGLDAYRHWDKLSYLEFGDRVEGASTADLGGSNVDNQHLLEVLPDGRHVLFDQTGPGILTFLRMQEDYGAPWQLLLDSQTPMTIQASDLGQMQPNSVPAQAFPSPLSLNPEQSQGSSLLMTALPFQRRLQWIAQAKSGNFYALYRKLPFGTPLPVWQSQTTPSDVLSMLRCAGRAPVSQTWSHQQGSLALAGGVRSELTTLAGPAQIRALRFRVPFQEAASFGKARLVIWWDGEKQPSVDTPVKFLVGDGAGVYQPTDRSLVQSWMTSAQGDGHSFLFQMYWPMPFAHSAQIALFSDQSLAHIDWSVDSEPFSDPPNWWGTFHANYVSVHHPVPGQDMTFLDVQGRGKLVGTVINFGTPDSTLEGDPHIYLDESQTPQIAVTGTEEWGLGGDYWHNGQQVSLPLGGLPSSSNNPPGADQDGAALYRFLIAESIPFNRRLVVRWEHGGADQIDRWYRAAMFWYATPTQTALLTDRIQPDQEPSRESHAYRAPGAQMFALQAAYEETVNTQESRANVVSMTGQTRFRLALDPANVGAFLRRTFDSCVPNQRAEVSIDGQHAGIWYDAGVSDQVSVDGHPRCWRDEDFPLPAALTQGKNAVTIELDFVPTEEPPDVAWTAVDYSIYSLVLPSLP
jgi:hypothetical protein